MKTPWRCWFTGGVAAVLAAASQAEPALDDTRSCYSRYSVEETGARIEVQARADGVPVFARLNASSPDGAALLLLVLGSDAAHTPVIQSLHGGAIALPLTLRVLPRDDGGSEVQYTAARGFAGLGNLPPELLARLELLPALMRAALESRDDPANG